MNTPTYTRITQAMMKAFALGYYAGRHIGIDDNPYSLPTYADEHRAYADGYAEGAADWGADA